MKLIKLTKGQFAQVDDDDYEWLNQWKWQALKYSNTYYARRQTCYKGKSTTVRMHRLVNNTPDHLFTDHIDHNGLNNQKSNLRNCTLSQNQQNRKSFGRSKYLGVVFDGTLIKATIQINKKSIHLGNFKTEEDAARARDKASLYYFGEFANLNFK